ncbi:uncharacterized protein H6S33_010464 [Morchella sextelata]|uniref:uncharacterized protein n=1 Tax=Morchella sextelata TaxID=1174677 RepID=UPI001D04F804|nr:uncharacterized protein H6S33_010464 [Morchella sextelata]KAH0612412.1 hypothetical protein H6S33_010464 [Morchella sextelata]
MSTLKLITPSARFEEWALIDLEAQKYFSRGSIKPKFEAEQDDEKILKPQSFFMLVLEFLRKALRTV